jgi:hypothetical protein
MIYMFAALQRIAEQRGDGLIPELAARLREMPRLGDDQPDPYRIGSRSQGQARRRPDHHCDLEGDVSRQRAHADP